MASETGEKVKTSRRTNRGPRQPSIRRDGKVTPHEAVIRALVESDPRICRNGFANAVRDLWIEVGEDEDDMPRLDIVPDAYLINHAAREVILYEVENYRLMTHDKEARLAGFWFSWDCADADWSVRCLAFNRFGRFTHEINLLGFWQDSLEQYRPSPSPVSTPLVQS